MCPPLFNTFRRPCEDYSTAIINYFVISNICKNATLMAMSYRIKLQNEDCSMSSTRYLYDPMQCGKGEPSESTRYRSIDRASAVAARGAFSAQHCGTGRCAALPACTAVVTVSLRARRPLHDVYDYRCDEQVSQLNIRLCRLPTPRSRSLMLYVRFVSRNSV